MIPKWTLFLRNGVINWKALTTNPKFVQYIRTLKDGPHELVIRKPTSKRSDPMNRYLWGVVYKLISEETGYGADQVHQLMKLNFGPVEFVDLPMQKPPLNQKRTVIPKSTTKYTVEEMQVYWEKIRKWSSEFLDLYIPDPREVEL